MPIGAGSFYGFSEWTCECWIYPTTINVFGSATLVDFYIFGQGGFRWSINSGGYLTYTDSGSGGATRTSNGNITFNAWNHIAICRSVAYGGVFFLINGGSSGFFGIVGGPTTPSQLVYIGALPNGESHLMGICPILDLLRVLYAIYLLVLILCQLLHFQMHRINQF